jgi:hypothetical protein
VNHRDLPRLAVKIGDVYKLIEGLCDRKARGKHTCVSLTKDLQLLREWEARGYPKGSSGANRAGKDDSRCDVHRKPWSECGCEYQPVPDVSDPTGNAALTHDIVLTVIDPVSGMPQNLEWWLSRLFDSAHAVLVIHELVNFTEKNQGRQAGGGDCQACGTFCSGADNDRLRGGYCNKCYTAWIRTGQDAHGKTIPNGRMDRFTFERMRKEAS